MAEIFKINLIWNREICVLPTKAQGDICRGLFSQFVRSGNNDYLLSESVIEINMRDVRLSCDVGEERWSEL